MSEDKVRRTARKSKKGFAESEEINHSLVQIAKGAGIVFFGMVIGKIIGYLYTIFVARLGTEQFGLLNLGFSVVSLVVALSLFGLDNGILRYIAYYQSKKDRARTKGAIVSSLKICLPLSIIFAILMLIFSTQIATFFFHNAKFIPILRIFAFMIPFSVVGALFLASFRAFQRVEYETGLKEVVEKAVKLILTIFLISLGFGVIGATYSYLFSAIIVFILAVFILEKRVFSIFRTKIKAKFCTRELLHYSIPLMFSSILVFVIIWTDTLMLGYFRTASEVGIYNAAHSTAALMFVLPTALIALFLPIITSFYGQKKYLQIKQLYKRVSRWIFFVNFPVFLIMAVFSRQILKIIFGQDYVSGATALTILVFSYLVYSMSYTSNNILSMAKKTKLVFFATLIFACSNIILNYILIPPYGINGAAIATSIAYLLGSTIFIFSSYKLIRIYPFDRFFFKAAVSGLLSIISVYYLSKFIFKPIQLYGLVLIFILFWLLYFTLLFLLRGFEMDDFEMAKLVFNKFKEYKTKII